MIFPGKLTEGANERRRARPALAPPCRSTRQIRLWKNYNDCHYSQSVSREGEREKREEDGRLFGWSHAVFESLIRF